MDTTVTRIVLDFVLSEPAIVRALRMAVETQCECSSRMESVSAAEQCVQQFIEEQMEDSLLPAFAERILRVALESNCDWRFVGERVLCSPENN